MIIVGGESENALSVCQHFVVYLLVILKKSVNHATVVLYLKGVHTVVIYIVLITLKTPHGVVVGYEKALFPAHSHKL